MAFPQTSSPATTQFAANSTSHNVALPATVNAGDLLLLHIMLEGPSSFTATPSGWTQLAQYADSTLGFACYAKVADGSEGGGAAGFTTSSGSNGAAHCYRITDWYGSIAGVEASSLSFGGSAVPNPGSLTASWGSADNLWFALAGGVDDDQAFTAAPSSYTSLVSTISGGGTNNGGEAGSARRELASDTDNPGSFTLQSTENWEALTVVVRPAAAVLSAGARLSMMGCGG